MRSMIFLNTFTGSLCHVKEFVANIEENIFQIPWFSWEQSYTFFITCDCNALINHFFQSSSLFTESNVDIGCRKRSKGKRVHMHLTLLILTFLEIWWFIGFFFCQVCHFLCSLHIIWRNKTVVTSCLFHLIRLLMRFNEFSIIYKIHSKRCTIGLIKSCTIEENKLDLFL